MRTNNSINGGLRFYVSVVPALFPAIVFLSISTVPYNLRVNSGQMKGNPIVERVKDIYTSQIGIREKQPNSGPDVEKYLEYVHLPKGNPWCAAFVCWVFGRAGVPNPRTGWSPNLFEDRHMIWDREQGTKNKEQRLPQIVPSVYPPILLTGNRQLATVQSLTKTHSFNSRTPNTGDIFGLYFPEKKRIAHVGFIDRWDGTWLVSVEGNTNVSGSREGDGVYRKRRLVRSIYKVARYVDGRQPHIAGK